MADFWHPIGGICISDLGNKGILFQVFHAMDVQRVLAGTPWFFNNHLIILHEIKQGEDPLVVPLSSFEFWVQVHDLPPRLLTKIMEKLFGNFLGQFLEYDTTIPTMGIIKFMRIRVRLDVSLPLKRKKKIQICKERIVYARFQYEKLSLFYFIYGKLGHGESFCPFRMHIDPSKIIFGWDISLRATGRCRNATTSRWLRDSDGSECNKVIMERNFMSQKSGRKHDLRRNSRGEMEKLPCNSIQADLESSQKFSIKGDCHWHNLDNNDINKTEYTGELMDLVLIEENDPLVSLEGKKRQRLVGASINNSENNQVGDSLILSASFAGQSSRLQ
ncbi:uncharacterized protein [Gossypium hirsutum]|uniref:DUF4283 domain-containing protein n=1 Tax=Gossypium hirsutum TaxID=3635 RepID=A0A1U8MAR4_GOSHI|nr:uncharacterized protein LOC107934673 [Gossypium hirsutum]